MKNISSNVAKEKDNIIKKLWAYRKYINVEPVLFLYMMPSMLNTIALTNFSLQKGCIANYSSIVCESILNVEKLGIDCDEFYFDSDFENDTSFDSGMLWNATELSSPNFQYTVCKAQLGAKTLSETVKMKRESIAAIFPFVLILLAGGWNDLYGKRKTCLMIPFIGKGLSFFALFISAIFFDTIPMEFGGYIEGLVPAMFGGFQFVLMAVNLYVTSSTPEPDRVLRYGILSIFVSCLALIGLAFSQIIFQKLGYVYLFALSWIFQVMGFLYVLFYIKEIKPSAKISKPVEGTDNSAFEMTDGSVGDRNHQVIAVVDEAQNEIKPKKKEPRLIEFFDATLILNCLKMPLEKRPNYGRALLIAMIVAYFLTAGSAFGERSYWYEYTSSEMYWNRSNFTSYRRFSAETTISGTLVGTVILHRILKISPPVIGIISALSVVLSRPVFAFAQDSRMFYAGGVVDMFTNLRLIAIKTIGSSIVQGNELGRMFALFGIYEPIAKFIFRPLYEYVYSRTVFPGAVFLFSELFFVPTLIIFIVCFVLFKMQNKRKLSY